MKYISICSGIEAATVAWRPLGWEPVAFAEIEAFPNAVLRHHYPNVPNLGDITKVDWRKYHGAVDIVVGGTPCQSFSVAGKREGMGGESGLVREYFRLLHEVRPRWFIWENVPGVLSDKGNAFQFILDQWHQCGYNVSYRVLDAQYWGVAQRRRRVFACGHLADWRNPAKVLFEWESLCRDFAPGRKARQEDTAGTQGCAYTPGSYGGYREGCGTLRATVGCASETLLSGYRMTAFGEYADDDTASTLKQRDYKDATDLVCSPIAFKIRQGKDGGGKGYLGSENQAFTLSCNQDQSLFLPQKERENAGTQEGNASEILRILREKVGEEAFAKWGLGILDSLQSEKVLRQAMHGVGIRRAAREAGLCMDDCALPCKETLPEGELLDLWENGPDGRSPQGWELAQQLARKFNKALPILPFKNASFACVRRLTPLEAERLQGFPDGYTDIIYRGKPAPDGARYKALGNSMAVPCMAWIGKRIQMVEDGEL